MTQVSMDGWLGNQNVVLGEVYPYHTEQASPHPFQKFLFPLLCVCVHMLSPLVVSDPLQPRGL